MKKLVKDVRWRNLHGLPDPLVSSDMECECVSTARQNLGDGQGCVHEPLHALAVISVSVRLLQKGR